MLDKLLATTANNAKLALAAIAGAALVAGGSAVALQQVADTTASDPAVVASDSPSPDATLVAPVVASVSDTSTATIPTESPKPSTSPKADGAQGVHGACVSAVAHDKSKHGREHGKAVSAAAHSCPKGGDQASATTAPTTAATTTTTAPDAENDSADAPETDAPETGDQGGHQKSGSHKHGKG